MYESPEDKVYNMSLPDIRSRDPTTGLIGSEARYQRLTFVCYFRDRLQQCDEGETAEYYARSGFDEAAEIEKAKSKPIKSLLLPQYNDIDDVEQSASTFAKTYRQRIPGGGTRRLQNFMSGSENQTKKRKRNYS
jgi:hypothetical protein